MRPTSADQPDARPTSVSLRLAATRSRSTSYIIDQNRLRRLALPYARQQDRESRGSRNSIDDFSTVRARFQVTQSKSVWRCGARRLFIRKSASPFQDSALDPEGDDRWACLRCRAVDRSRTVAQHRDRRRRSASVGISNYIFTDSRHFDAISSSSLAGAPAARSSLDLAKEDQGRQK